MNVLLCDAHTLFTEALQTLFRQRGDVARVTSSPRQAAEVLRRADADVDIVLMDIAYPDDGDVLYDGDAVRTVSAVAEHARIVVVTACSDRRRLQDATAAGAAAVTLKSQPLSELFAVLERVAGGETVLTSDVATAAAARARRAERPPESFLTTREREVLARLTRGESTRQIARDMGVAYSTARTHIQSVLDKLGVHSRLEAVAYAARHQLAWPTSWSETAARSAK
jgi:DNA-binding NarL/FixJ family response regulator